MRNNPIREYIAKVSPKIKVGRLVSGIILAYLTLITGEAIIQNYQINKEIVQLRTEIAYLGQEKTQLQHLIAYLKTESFKEKEARRKLGYQKPGELVIALPKDNFIHTDPGITKSGDESNSKPTRNTNPQKWWDFIFG